jgi:hypothetical protein
MRASADVTHCPGKSNPEGLVCEPLYATACRILLYVTYIQSFAAPPATSVKCPCMCPACHTVFVADSGQVWWRLSEILKHVVSEEEDWVGVQAQ